MSRPLESPLRGMVTYHPLAEVWRLKSPVGAKTGFLSPAQVSHQLALQFLLSFAGPASASASNHREQGQCLVVESCP